MRGIGLPLAYFGSFSLVHGGGFVYALPWYDPTTDAYLRQTGGGIEYTAAGLLVSLIGIIGLLVGVWGSDKLRQSGPPSSIRRRINVCGQEQILLMLGAAFFFVVHPIASR